MGDPGVDGRVILKWIFRKWHVGLWTGLMWFRIGACGVVDWIDVVQDRGRWGCGLD